LKKISFAKSKFTNNFLATVFGGLDVANFKIEEVDIRHLKDSNDIKWCDALKAISILNRVPNPERQHLKVIVGFS